MKTAAQWFEEYGQSHQHPANKKIHWVCVPLIMFSTIALFAALPEGPLRRAFPGWSLAHWGTVLVALALIFYLRLSFKLFIGMLVISAICLMGVELLRQLAVPLWLSAGAIFVLAWIGQFIGHKIEGKKPSFFQDLQFLLVGPAWVINFLYRRLGWSV